MPDKTAGGFEWSGVVYRFDEASCCWDSEGLLRFRAVGRRCWIQSEGLPFEGIIDFSGLPGQIWEAVDYVAEFPDTFAGALESEGGEIEIMASRIECWRFDADERRLVLALRLCIQVPVQNGQYVREEAVEGIVYAAVLSREEYQA
jgi:hypothetical protein